MEEPQELHSTTGISINDNIYTSLESNSSEDYYSRRYKTYSKFEEIDWSHEYQRERAYNRNTRKHTLPSNVLQWSIILLASIATGITVSFIDGSSIWINDLKTGYCKKSFFSTKLTCCLSSIEGQSCENWHDWNFSIGNFLSHLFFSLVLTTIGYFIASHVQNISRSGIAEIKVIISGLMYDDFLTINTFLAKSISLILVVGAGMWIGKEGPLVHISCNVISILYHFLNFKNEAIKRELLSTGVSVGIALSFNAPIGGVLFILEQGYSNLKILNIMWKSFICATLSVIILRTFHPFTDGRNIIFALSDNKDWLIFEILPFILLGVLGGVFGSLFVKLNLFFAQYRKSRKFNPLNEILLLTVATVFLTYPLIFNKLPLSLLVVRLFRDCETNDSSIIGGLCDFESDGSFQSKPFFLLILNGLVGFFLTAYTYGTLLPGGILMPSLAIGACFGRSLGIIMDHIHVTHPHLAIFSKCPAYLSPVDVVPVNEKCISMGVYGVIGAASFLAGITKSTVSVVVIMFELTGALNYVLPIMISVLVAKMFNDSLVMKNIYERWINFSGFYSLDENLKDNVCVPDIDTSEIMATDVPVLYLNETQSSGELLQLVQRLNEKTSKSNRRNESDHYVDGFPVLNSLNDRTLIGYISLGELSLELEKLKMLPNFDWSGKICFQDIGKEGSASSVATDQVYENFTNFEVRSTEEDNFSGINGADNDKLSLYHLIESAANIPVFRQLHLSTAVDLIYKVNYNYLMFTDDRGNFMGMVTKYSMIDLVESEFSIINY